MKHVPAALVSACALSCAATVAEAPEPQSASPKNIILLIGDGFGVQQIGLFHEYATRAPRSVYAGRETTVSRLMREGVLGLSMTATPKTLVVDSAASATQLASGKGGINGMVGLDQEQAPVATLLDRAKRAGLATGVVSDARITHATPAAFLSHVDNRHKENEIAEQIISSDVDLILGGGLRHFVPRSKSRSDQLRERLEAAGLDGAKSKRVDGRDLVAEAEAAGRSVVFSRQELTQTKQGPLLGLFNATGMNDAMTERRLRGSPQRTEPSLPELARFSLERLSANPKGFVLVLEVAQIDWAGHANDAGWMLNETIKLDETLEVLLEFAEKDEDTLLLVTGDHETGGFGFTYKSGPTVISANIDQRLDYGDPRNLDILANQRRSADSFLSEFIHSNNRSPERLLSLVKSATDIPYDLDDAKDALNAPSDSDTMALGKSLRSRVMRTLAARINGVWATGNHTSTPVELLSFGPGANRFRGLLRHTEVGVRLLDALPPPPESNNPGSFP